MATTGSVHRRLCGAAALMLALAVATAAAAGELAYIPPGAVTLERYLPPPPSPGSEEARRDLQAVLELQHGRTASEVAEAQADQEVSVFRFADVMGPEFTARRLPLTAVLARRACRESGALTAAAKRHWDRPRPFVASEAVEPVLRRPANASYPSGHSACGYLWAILLGEMLPEQRSIVLRRGMRYGMNRVVGGVHYPSDVEAGRIAAVAVATALFASEAFRNDFHAARAELHATLPGTAAPRVEPAPAGASAPPPH